MTLLGIDIGTTHCKAGLFHPNGETIQTARRKMVTQYAPEGYAYFDPETLWASVADVIREVAADSVTSIGISSMAESGLLLDRKSGEPRTVILPWFDRSAQPQAEQIAANSDPVDFFIRTGLHINYKTSLAKILWLKERDDTILEGAIWLSVADYVAYRLTGHMGTDYSLAGRTGAFHIHNREWEPSWLARWELTPNNFPAVLPSGQPMGETMLEWTELGLPKNTPVAISGHDHLCAAFVASLISAGRVFDSMGTAEVLIGAFPQRSLNQMDYDSGMLSGCHVIENQGYWLGSLSSSGKAVEWMRYLFNDVPLSYDDLSDLVNSMGSDPTGILFFPYLLGSGAPHNDPFVKAGWIGLRNNHSRAHLVKAVLEGTAYEMELIRRAGEKVSGEPITALTAAGGGTRNRPWLQIKADVCGLPIQAMTESEATLLGAALRVDIRQNSNTGAIRQYCEIIEPDLKRHAIFRTLFEQGYMEFQESLRRFSTINRPTGIDQKDHKQNAHKTD